MRLKMSSSKRNKGGRRYVASCLRECRRGQRDWNACFHPTVFLDNNLTTLISWWCRVKTEEKAKEKDDGRHTCVHIKVRACMYWPFTGCRTLKNRCRVTDLPLAYSRGEQRSFHEAAAMTSLEATEVHKLGMTVWTLTTSHYGGLH